MKKLSFALMIIIILILAGCSNTKGVKILPRISAPENSATGQPLNVKLEWFAFLLPNQNATYDVYFGTSESLLPVKFKDLKTKEAVVDKLELNKTYYWKVTAKYNTGEELTSTVAKFTTTSKVPYVSVPTNKLPANSVNIKKLSKNTIDFEWEAAKSSTGATVTYNLYLDTKETPATVIATDLNTTRFSHVITTTDAAITKFYWKVIAVDKNKLTSTSNIWNFSLKNNEAPKFSNIPEQKADPGTVLTVDLSKYCIDSENDKITYTLASNMTNAKISGNNFILNCNYEYVNGSYPVKIKASDGELESETTLTITVNHIITKPFPQNETKSPYDRLEWYFSEVGTSQYVYDVYIGEYETSLQIKKENVSGRSVSGLSLKPDTKYFWKVAAKKIGSSEIIESRIWNFTTMSKYSESSGDTPLAIGDDRVVYYGNSNKLYAVNVDGSQKWVYESEGTINTSPVIAPSGHIYVVCSDKKLYKINTDGTLNTKYELNDQTNLSPSVDSSGNIYISDGFSLIKISGSTRSELYTFDKTKTEKIISSPTIDKISGNIFLTTNLNNIYIFSSSGVKVEAKNVTEGLISVSNPVGNDKVYIKANNHLYVLNKIGSELWDKEVTGGYIQSITLGNDESVYLRAGNMVYGFTASGVKKWEITLPLLSANTPEMALSENGTLYLTTDQSSNNYEPSVYAINTSTGAIIWKGYGTGEPIIDSSGNVYLWSGKDRIVIKESNGGPANSPWSKARGNNKNTGVSK